MASPQVENGYAPISQELLQALARARLKATTRAVVDCIVSMTYGWHRKTAPIALDFFVDWTGYPKITIRRSLRELFDRKMIKVWNGKPASYAIQKDYDRWIPEREYREQRKASQEGLHQLKSAQRGSTSESAHSVSQGVPSAQRGSTSKVLNGGAPEVLNGGSQKVLNGGAPTIIHRIQNTSPSAEIISNAGNGDERVTWLTPYNGIWKAAYGGNLPFKAAAKWLREAEKAIGRDQAIENFGEFCKQDVKFLGKPEAALSKFAATCGSWNPSKRKTLNPEAERIARLQRASQVV